VVKDGCKHSARLTEDREAVEQWLDDDDGSMRWELVVVVAFYRNVAGEKGGTADI
jgi:hypothetical protein